MQTFKSVAYALIGIVALSFFWVSCSNNNSSRAKVPPKTDTVEISSMKFNPDTITINKGDTVFFINKGFVDHDATQFPDSTWQSPRLKPGDSWSVVPRKTTEYFCSIHVVMKGRIILK